MALPIPREEWDRKRAPLFVKGGERAKAAGHKAGALSVARARETWDRFIAAIAVGHTIKEACAIVDRTPNAWDQWRKKHPEYIESFANAKRASKQKRHASRAERVEVAEAKAKMIDEERREFWEHLADNPDDDPDEFALFGKRYFARSYHPHHQLMVDTLESVGPREVVLFLIWPEAGKTTTMEDFVARKLAKAPDHRFRFVSESENLGLNVVRRVKTIFTDSDAYPDFIARYGPFEPEDSTKPWQAKRIVIDQSTGGERDASLMAVGWNSASLGSRIDTLVVDDIQSLRSIGQTNSMLDALRQTYFTRGKEMRTFVVGSRQGPDDVYARLIELGLVTRIVKVPAAGGLGAEPDDPTVPQWWETSRTHDGKGCCPTVGPLAVECPRDETTLTPKQYMTLIRYQVGERVWAASYQQDPDSDELSTFGGLVDTCLNEDRSIGAPEGPHAISQSTGSVDPALGGGCSVMTCLWTPEKLYVTDLTVEYDLSKNEQIFTMMAQHAGKWDWRVGIMEYDAQQKGIGNDTRLREMAAIQGYRIQVHTTRGKKADPQYGVPRMERVFLRRELDIPWDLVAREKMRPLVNQLHKWRPDIPTRQLEQDAVMTLWMQWQAWEQWRTGVADGWDDDGQTQDRPSWMGSDPRFTGALA